MTSPTPGQISGALLSPDFWWSGPTVTFSLPTGAGAWSGYDAGDEPFDSHYAALSAAQAARFAAAVAAWDAVIALSLPQVDDGQPGQIRVAFTDISGDHDDQGAGEFWGHAYSPAYRGGTAPGEAGDVWIHYAQRHADFSPTSFDFMATIHELGHALGLKHPFGDGEALPDAYQTRRYTVMSYTNYADNLYRVIETTASGLQSTPKAVYATTPMVLDIAALQARYGADPATNAGDTVYAWDQAQPLMQAIYDAGGIDTFDLSAHTRASIVDLTPGAYSSIAHWSAEAQAAYWSGQYAWAADWITGQINQASTYTWSDNLGIAFGTVIENVTGGAGGDTVSGNAAGNRLLGRLGDDSIAGDAGDDYLRGDEGSDRLAGGEGFDDLNGNMGDDLAWGGQGPDWVVGGKDADRLYGEAGDDIVYGNMGADTLEGGAGNDLVRGGQDDDQLNGGDGADWLSGDRGTDVLTGGAGADTFHIFAGAGADRVTDFETGDRVQVAAGSAYAVRQEGADVVIDLGGGDRLTLSGVTLGSLASGWIFEG